MTVRGKEYVHKTTMTIIDLTLSDGNDIGNNYCLCDAVGEQV